MSREDLKMDIGALRAEVEMVATGNDVERIADAVELLNLIDSLT